MSVKLLSESNEATITDADKLRIEAILTFWFKEQNLSAPQIDGRMDVWFGRRPRSSTRRSHANSPRTWKTPPRDAWITGLMSHRGVSH